MKERPILFSAPMVRAILDGRKTQTRRILKVENHPAIFDWVIDTEGRATARAKNEEVARQYATTFPHGRVKPKYGKIGDHLWVREEHYRFGHWEIIPGVKTKGGRTKNQFVADTDEVRFEAPKEFRKGRHHKDPLTPAWHKRLARFMPKKFSRITLEITNVRVDRLQDISAKDIIAEGAVDRPHNDQHFGKMPVSAFDGMAYTDLRSLWAAGWEKINGKGSWTQNPWVWVIEFKKL